MIIINYSYGGIGNQMYQYALQLALEEKYPEQEIKADFTSYYLIKDFSYGFGLRRFFDIHIEEASTTELNNIYYGIVNKPYFSRFPQRVRMSLLDNADRNSKLCFWKAKLKENVISEKVFSAYNGNVFDLDKNHDWYFNGIWQNIQYFEWISEKVKKAFALKPQLSDEDKRRLEEIRESQSVCIHVRRGNFLTHPNVNICDMNYYRKAINLMRKCKEGNLHFFVFSDDIEYCKKYFKDLEKVTFISHPADRCDIDMYLMGQCSNAIIPNSTFAFWAIYLGDNGKKKIICPRYSVREKDIWHEFSVPNTWLKIDNLGLIGVENADN